MELHSLKPTTSKKKKRLGRGYGSRAGAKSGRGTKRHQKAREKIKPWFEGGQNPMTKKFPLLRGKGKNKSVKEKPILINLAHLEKMAENTRVDIDVLIKNKIIDKRARSTGVKVVASGKLTKPLQIALTVSKKVKEVVEGKGGKIVS